MWSHCHIEIIFKRKRKDLYDRVILVGVAQFIPVVRVLDPLLDGDRDHDAAGEEAANDSRLSGVWPLQPVALLQLDVDGVGFAGHQLQRLQLGRPTVEFQLAEERWHPHFRNCASSGLEVPASRLQLCRLCNINLVLSNILFFQVVDVDDDVDDSHDAVDRLRDQLGSALPYPSEASAGVVDDA